MGELLDRIRTDGIVEVVVAVVRIIPSVAPSKCKIRAALHVIGCFDLDRPCLSTTPVQAFDSTNHVTFDLSCFGSWIVWFFDVGRSVQIDIVPGIVLEPLTTAKKEYHEAV